MLSHGSSDPPVPLPHCLDNLVAEKIGAPGTADIGCFSDLLSWGGVLEVVIVVFLQHLSIQSYSIVETLLVT